jgi:hypothetical protein
MSTASWPARVQLGDAAVAVRVVVHGVDHDLARESRRGQPVVGLQRHGRHHQVTGAGGLLGGGRPRVPAEFGDEAGECLRSASSPAATARRASTPPIMPLPMSPRVFVTVGSPSEVR